MTLSVPGISIPFYFLWLFILISPIWNKLLTPVNPKGNKLWIFIGRTDAEVEASILWPPDAKNQLFGKDPDLGTDWRQEEKGVTEDEMVEWHHWLSGHEFKQTLCDSEGQGRLACCSPWGRKELNTTEWLNNSKWYLTMYLLNLFLFVVVSAYKNKRTRREN